MEASITAVRQLAGSLRSAPEEGNLRAEALVCLYGVGALGERTRQDGPVRPRRNGACRAATLMSDSGGELSALDTEERRSAASYAAPDAGRTVAGGAGVGGAGVPRQQLWVEEPAVRRRMPDPVRTAAVRAVLITSLTLIQAVVAFLSTMAGSWLAFPMVLSSVASTVGATWSVLDVWVTRQVWNQRNGVVSMPSSSARALRRERRRARRAARTVERDGARIRRRGSGSLSRA